MKKSLPNYFMQFLLGIVLVLCCPGFLHAQCTNSGTALTATTTVSNINCSSTDGSITVNASGGWVNTAAANGTGYTYAITAGPATRPSQSNNVFGAPLGTGTYTVSITDCNGTTITRTATIGGTAPAAISAAPVVFRSLCATDNGVKINASGGRAPYTYAVVSAPAGSSPFWRGDTLRGLAAGTLNYTVTDACGTVFGATVSITSNTSGSIGFSPILRSIACAGINRPAAAPFNGGVSTGYEAYFFLQQSNPSQLLPWDTVKIEPYYNGSLLGTFYVTTGNQLLDATKTRVNLSDPDNNSFSGTNTIALPALPGGFGNYSVVLTHNSACPITNTTNFVRNTASPFFGFSVSSARCSDMDMSLIVWNGLYNPGSSTSGQSQTSGDVTFTIIAGPAGTVGSTQVASGTGTVTFNNMPYGSYTVATVDQCGKRDTISRNFPAAAFTASSDINGCADNMRIAPRPGKNNMAISEATFPGLPKTYPIVYTLLAGPSTFWTTYPFSVTVNSANAFHFPNIPPGVYQLSAENACGQRDTINVTINNIVNTLPSVTTVTITPKCGSNGDITINTSPGTRNCSGANYNFQSAALVSGPAGHSVSTLSNLSTFSWLNQPAGTYVFNLRASCKGYTSLNSNNLCSGSYATLSAFQLAGGVGTTTLSGPLDTAAFLSWDTTITVVVAPTTLAPAPKYAYLCKASTTARLEITNGAAAVVPPVTYQYSLTGNSGPWSAAQADSFFVIPGVPAGTQVWFRVQDGCGNMGITQTTTANLTASITNTCATGIATLVPTPYNNFFLYELVNRSTGAVVGSYNGTSSPITVDLSNPANAGDYTLRYKLEKEGAGGCIIDSLDFKLWTPCRVLPVRLSSFNARIKADCSVGLSWQAEAETSFKQYEVEYSTNGANYSPVGVVAAQGGGLYSFQHKPAAGRSLYRLKMEDVDGRYEYSQTIVLNTSCTGLSVVVYPNPAGETVHVNVSGFTGQISGRLYNGVGQLMQSRTLVNGSNALAVATLAEGIYTLVVQDAAGNREVYKLQLKH